MKWKESKREQYILWGIHSFDIPIRFTEEKQQGKANGSENKNSRNQETFGDGRVGKCSSDPPTTATKTKTKKPL